MKRPRFVFALILLIGLLCMPPLRVDAAPHSDVEADTVTFEFPNTATFSASLTSAAPIVSVTLEYGNDQLTCGDVLAKAFPEFDPGSNVNVSWTWDMRQSGSLPPGAHRRFPAVTFWPLVGASCHD